MERFLWYSPFCRVQNYDELHLIFHDSFEFIQVFDVVYHFYCCFLSTYVLYVKKNVNASKYSYVDVNTLLFRAS